MSTKQETKYFQIIGGDTVLQHDANGWIRWDPRDGLVKTDIVWFETDSRLREITKDEAINLLK